MKADVQILVSEKSLRSDRFAPDSGQSDDSMVTGCYCPQADNSGCLKKPDYGKRVGNITDLVLFLTTNNEMAKPVERQEWKATGPRFLQESKGARAQPCWIVPESPDLLLRYAGLTDI